MAVKWKGQLDIKAAEYKGIAHKSTNSGFDD